MRQFVQGDADERVRGNVGRECCASIVGRGVVRSYQSEELELRIPHRDLILALDRRGVGQSVKRRVARRGVIDQVGTNGRIANKLTIVGLGSRASSGSGIV